MVPIGRCQSVPGTVRRLTLAELKDIDQIVTELKYQIAMELKDQLASEQSGRGDEGRQWGVAGMQAFESPLSAHLILSSQCQGLRMVIALNF